MTGAKAEIATDGLAATVADRVTNSIFVLYGQRVMLDADLARLYGVTTGALNQAVKRNPERFPEDFMFQVTREEAEAVLVQNHSL